MHDDRFDEALSRRLHAYESRLPDADQPSAGGRLRSRGLGWAALAGGAVAAVAAGALAFVVIGGALDRQVGSGASDPPSPSISASPSASVPSSAPSPTASDLPAPTSTGPSPSSQPVSAVPNTWTVVTSFVDPDRRFVAADLVAWSGQLVAIGSQWSEAHRSVFGPPPDPTGKVWASSDGLSWSDVSPTNRDDGTAPFAQTELRHAFVTADGSLVVVGDRWSTPEAGGDVATVAQETRDGVTWRPYAFEGMPGEAYIAAVATGTRGHLAGIWHDDGSGSIWHSEDGRAWTKHVDAGSVTSLDAGDEGFAAIIHDSETPSETRIIASGDGREWIDADFSDRVSVIGALGPDWLAAGSSFGSVDEDGRILATTWTSANALAWIETASMRLGPADEQVPCGEGIAGLASVGRVAFLSTGRCGEGGVMGAGRAYAGVDGGPWQPLPFGDYARVAGAAVLGDRLVVVTDTSTGFAVELGVTIWVGDLP